MKQSIRFKLIFLILAISLGFGSLLSLYSPSRSRKLSNQLLLNNAEYISNLLGENLALGMQMRLIDDGESLRNSLELLNEDTDSNNTRTINYIRVFDQDLTYIIGYNDSNVSTNITKVSELTSEEKENSLLITTPMGENDGFIEIDFSKEFLLSQISSDRTVTLIIAGFMIIIVFVSGILFVNNIVKKINKLASTAELVAIGDTSVEIDLNTDKEIEVLASSFKNITDALKDKAVAAERIANGDLDVNVSVLSESDTLGKAMKSTISNLNMLIEETTKLINSAKSGELSVRGTADGFSGAYSKLVSGVNEILDSVVAPIDEAGHFLDKLSDGDLTSSIKTDYKGDHAKIKNSLNGTIESLNSILIQVTSATNIVDSRAKQVSDSSQSLSQGATEQAASLEEISSSVTEIASQTKKNAENAGEANNLAEQSQQGANNGNSKMQEMLEAISGINESSNKISSIIKVIDEIAFQTNLLALNAAVEAARAGEHGKGFAVVAEEVRNLARRSAEAAKETTELIEDSIKRVENGTNIANETADALGGIVEDITKASTLIGEIASSSNNQAQGIEQITNALSQIDGVTQNNTSNAEETASASIELSGQAQDLVSVISKFKLSENFDENVMKTQTSNFTQLSEKKTNTIAESDYLYDAEDDLSNF